MNFAAIKHSDRNTLLGGVTKSLTVVPHFLTDLGENRYGESHALLKNVNANLPAFPTFPNRSARHPVQNIYMLRPEQ